MKIAIIGTGISGLSIARMLQKDHQVTLFERAEKPGGLIKCERVRDCLFHKVGGHVFNSKNQAVLDWFWGHFDRDNEFLQAKRKAKVYFKGNIIGYPIENYIYLLEKPLVDKIISELLELQKQPATNPFDFPNFETFLRKNFGDTLYEEYFGPYNHKIWRTDLSTVAMQWLEGKLPMPNYREVILSNVLREEEDNMVHGKFYYPKYNGSQFIVDRLKEGLDIKTASTVVDVEHNDGKYTVNGTSGFDKIVWCGDVRKLPVSIKAQLDKSGVDLNVLDNLRSNGTSNLFCETDDNDISWLYIPENFTKAHRIIYTGNFSETNNAGSQRKTCVVEFSGQVDYETMVEEIKKLPGNLSPISFNYEPNSYVVQDIHTRPTIAKVREVLEPQGFYLLGRFAEWEYYNMDKAIEAAFDLRQKIS
jgi:protoporphyrinogen oxidase